LIGFCSILFPPPKERCRILYVSPLKALAVDVEKNLQAPIEGVFAGGRTPWPFVPSP
jgi:Lhr-like helicase